MSKAQDVYKELAKEEWIQKNLYTLQVQLVKQRRQRTVIMSILLSALLLTVIYGTLENPFSYTLSNIGNFFDYRLFFIIWAIISGLAILISIVALFRLEEYKAKMKYWFVGLSSFFLVVTSLIPALKDIYPFWHWAHTVCAGLNALFMFLSLNPFVNFVSRENPRLRFFIRVWLTIIWGGSILSLIFLGKSGIFELWFFVSMIIFLLYLSLVLFEEKIVKMSVSFLKDETNLNSAIEKLFIDLERTSRKSKKTAVGCEDKILN